MHYIQLSEQLSFLRKIAAKEVIEWDETHLCSPSELTQEERVLFRVYPLKETEVPAYDKMIQGVRESDPVCIHEVWTQQWEVYPLPAEDAEANIANAVAQREDALWAGANAYTSSFISGIAVGMLTMGVMLAKPKALAVQAWSKSVWGEYYARKAAVTPYSTVDCDFSSFGPMPHSVPELMEELGL